jgi:hypothetical protein
VQNFAPPDPSQSRHRISLAALLAGWGLVAFWFAWSRVTVDVIDDIQRYEQAHELAKSQPLHPEFNAEEAIRRRR